MFSLVLLYFSALSTTALAQTAAEPGDRCLNCHTSRAITGKGGRKVYIDRQAFEATAHAPMGCTSCHDAVSENHPGSVKTVAKVNCSKCHEQTSIDYSQSTHAPNASCADCHDAHTVRSAEAASPDQMNARCAKCHEAAQTVESHAKWLPQMQLHINSLPCIACHTSSPEYVITMFIGKRNEQRDQKAFVPLTFAEFNERTTRRRTAVSLIDQNADNSISLDELRRFHRASEEHGMWLYGVMMPQKVTHSFGTLKNRLDCTFCHAKGPDARQTSYVAIPRENQGYQRLPVEKGAILDILYGTPDFYMVGSTRSLFLSLAAAAIIAGGAMFPLVHGTFRVLTRKNRQKKGH